MLEYTRDSIDYFEHLLSTLLMCSNKRGHHAKHSGVWIACRRHQQSKKCWKFCHVLDFNVALTFKHWKSMQSLNTPLISTRHHRRPAKEGQHSNNSSGNSMQTPNTRCIETKAQDVPWSTTRTRQTRLFEKQYNIQINGLKPVPAFKTSDLEIPDDRWRTN